MLKTSDLGSLDTGTPIYFRRLQVGQVASYSLDKDGKIFTIKVFVQAPYDQYVNREHALLAGERDRRVAFGQRPQRADPVAAVDPDRRRRVRDRPRPALVLPPAEANTVFTLYSNRTEAFRPPPRNPQTYRLIFKESVRGLTPGAPVEFRGIPIGEVADIRAQIDLKTFEFSVPVTIQSGPARDSGSKCSIWEPGVDLETMRRKLIDALVAHGVRAQLADRQPADRSRVSWRSTFSPARRRRRWTGRRRQCSCRPFRASSQATEASVENIIKKLDKMPLQQIGEELQKAIARTEYRRW